MESPKTKKNEIIICKNVWKSYNGLKVLKGLNLTVFDGETLVILGRSGVGKSVLLKQILGIERPDEGSIEINGEITTDMGQNARYKAAQSMGMLFQGSALFDSMNVEENTAFYLHQHEQKLGNKEIKNRVDHALEMVGLAGTQAKMPSDLSGGMRKRAALARLIVYRPHIILYDEPTTGLDPITSMQINDLINTTKKELNATSIVVTHDLRSAMAVGDRLAFHCDGVIRQIGTKHEFIHSKDPLVQAFFNNAILTNEILAKE